MPSNTFSFRTDVSHYNVVESLLNFDLSKDYSIIHCGIVFKMFTNLRSYDFLTTKTIYGNSLCVLPCSLYLVSNYYISTLSPHVQSIRREVKLNNFVRDDMACFFPTFRVLLPTWLYPTRLFIPCDIWKPISQVICVFN